MRLLTITIALAVTASQALASNDPLYVTSGSWGQDYADQWALQTVLEDPERVQTLVGSAAQPVVVAMIDTGLDWDHLDFSSENLWNNNDEIPDNNIDDDGNGYVDDIIGYNFIDRNNLPWDYDGHGTLTAGIIAAQSNNDFGMAGINPNVRLMVLKAVNDFGNTRAAYLAEAISYAVDNGARIINLSVGGPDLTNVEEEALKQAEQRGVLVVVAAGNNGEELKNYGFANADHVLTVAAIDPEKKRAQFSNWGEAIDVAAPGVDVLSLRARRTDTLLAADGYTPRSAYVGLDNRHYRISGTSFAVPFVSGVASLLLSRAPGLDAESIARVIKNSAEDIEAEGIDLLTGYGLVNAIRALNADPYFFINAEINGVRAQKGDNPAVEVLGTARANQFKSATLSLARADDPENWTEVAQITSGGNQPCPAKGCDPTSLATIPQDQFNEGTSWQLKLVVEHTNEETRTSLFDLTVKQRNQ